MCWGCRGGAEGRRRVEGDALVLIQSPRPPPPFHHQVDELKKEVKDEVWAIYYARYELAMVWHRLDGGGSERVLAQLSRAYARKDHNFDIMLHVRINMAQYHCKHVEELGLDTGCQAPGPLVPVPSAMAISEEYDALEAEASAKLDRVDGALGAALDAAKKESHQAASAEQAANVIDYNAIWWRGIDDPEKVTAV